MGRPQHAGDIDATSQNLATNGDALARVKGSHEAAGWADPSSMTTTSVPDHLELLPIEEPRSEFPSPAPCPPTPATVAGAGNNTNNGSISVPNKTANGIVNVTGSGTIQNHTANATGTANHTEVAPTSAPTHRHHAQGPRRRITVHPRRRRSEVQHKHVHDVAHMVPRRRRTSTTAPKTAAKAKATTTSKAKAHATAAAKATTTPKAHAAANATANAKEDVVNMKVPRRHHTAPATSSFKG